MYRVKILLPVVACGMYDMRDISSPPGVALISSGCSVLDTGVRIILCKIQQSLGTLRHIIIIVLMNLTNPKEKVSTVLLYYTSSVS